MRAGLVAWEDGWREVCSVGLRPVPLCGPVTQQLPSHSVSPAFGQPQTPRTAFRTNGRLLRSSNLAIATAIAVDRQPHDALAGFSVDPVAGIGAPPVVSEGGNTIKKDKRNQEHAQTQSNSA